jgi:hypothetical protein
MSPPSGEITVTLLLVLDPPLMMPMLPAFLMPPALGPSALVPVPRAICFYSFRVFIVSADL